MTTERIPLLWICGPSGVGKTTVGWEIFSRLTRAGVRAAYVDIDQLGIFHPEPPSDPGRYLTKSRNLRGIVNTFRDAGAVSVITSGVVDPVRGAHRDLLPEARVTVCRLRADGDELRHRLAGRRVRPELVEDAVLEADELDATGFADVTVDTTGLSVDEVVRRVPEPGRSRARGPVEKVSRDAVTPLPGGRVLWLCGATGAGKSTVGFQLYLRAAQAGWAVAYLDLDQVGFGGPAPHEDPPNHRVKARNAAALWRTYRDVGVERLLLVGPLESAGVAGTYATSLGAEALRVCRLHAGGDELTRRILRRGHGGGSWPQPGDPLKGQPAERLARIARQAIAGSAALERAGVGDLRVDTDGRTVREVAGEIVARTGWPLLS